MATPDIKEGDVGSASQGSDLTTELKNDTVTPQEHKSKDSHDAAEQGQTATDLYGNALVEIDPVAEARLRWKLDLCVVPTVALLYLFSFIDRANIGNARLAGLEKDLNITGYGFNQLLSVFFISYILFEIPATLACKWIGPGWFLPATSLAFGIASLGMAYVQDLPSACAVRFVLGIFEAGVLPGVAYYLSRWYRQSELTFRLTLYIVMAPLAGAFGGLLASGILRLDGVAGLHQWRMIFFVEGLITISLAVISFFTLTDRPETAWWLSEEEKKLAILRLKVERVSTTRVLDKMDWTKIKRGLLNPVSLTTGVVFFLNGFTVHGLSYFAPTIVRTIYPRSSTISQQLHTVPPYAVGAFFALLVPYISWRCNRRLVMMICSGPLVVIGYIMFLATDETQGQVRYGATFLITSGLFQFGALCNAQVSANVVSDSARSAAIGITVMFNTIGGLISTWSYLPLDGPNYPIGNGMNLAFSATNMLVLVGLLFWMMADNKRRERNQANATEMLQGMEQHAIEDLDWKHPGFRWKL